MMPEFTIYDINASIAIEERVREFLCFHGDHSAYGTTEIDNAVRLSEYRLEALKHIRDNLNG